MSPRAAAGARLCGVGRADEALRRLQGLGGQRDGKRPRGRKDGPPPQEREQPRVAFGAARPGGPARGRPPAASWRVPPATCDPGGRDPGRGPRRLAAPPFRVEEGQGARPWPPCADVASVGRSCEGASAGPCNVRADAPPWPAPPAARGTCGPSLGRGPAATRRPAGCSNRGAGSRRGRAGGIAAGTSAGFRGPRQPPHGRFPAAARARVA
jgi:hypothetical protein